MLSLGAGLLRPPSSAYFSSPAVETPLHLPPLPAI